MFSRESAGGLQEQESQQSVVDCIPPGLQESHLDTYFEYAQVWCPILDRDVFESNPELQRSLLLRHALALCGNQIKPPLLVHASSMDHYTRAKEIFYGNHEPNPLIRIIALMLFYWWSAEPPNVVSLDTTSWWTGTAIRLAQQVGLHRESAEGSPALAGESPGLRRRIWWTLVVRLFFYHRLTQLRLTNDRPANASQRFPRASPASSIWTIATSPCRHSPTSQAQKANPHRPPSSCTGSRCAKSSAE